VRLGIDTFDFVTAMQPTSADQQLAGWATDPSESEPDD
jgi:hypothetical protein